MRRLALAALVAAGIGCCVALALGGPATLAAGACICFASALGFVPPMKDRTHPGFPADERRVTR